MSEAIALRHSRGIGGLSEPTLEAALARDFQALSGAVPAQVAPARLARLFMVQATRTPRLLDCSHPSIYEALMVCAELGLEPGPTQGFMYLIPRETYDRRFERRVWTCSAQIGYKGLLELMRRSGCIARANADVIYQSEIDAGLVEFCHEPPSLTHRANFGVLREGPIAGAYAVVETQDGARYQVLLSYADCLARGLKGRSFALDAEGHPKAKRDSPWITDTAAMCRKTAIRALLSGGLVPLSAELVRAFEAEPMHVAAPSTPAVRAVDTLAEQARRLDPPKALPNPADDPAEAGLQTLWDACPPEYRACVEEQIGFSVGAVGMLTDEQRATLAAELVRGAQ